MGQLPKLKDHVIIFQPELYYSYTTYYCIIKLFATCVSPSLFFFFSETLQLLPEMQRHSALVRGAACLASFLAVCSHTPESKPTLKPYHHHLLSEWRVLCAHNI
jgi:hypothetical protein